MELKCKCGAELEAYVSCCTDSECCDTPHRIRCTDRPYAMDHTSIEFYDYDEFEEKWLELGGTEESMSR
jgi:hypothetical protein